MMGKRYSCSYLERRMKTQRTNLHPKKYHRLHFFFVRNEKEYKEIEKHLMQGVFHYQEYRRHTKLPTFQ